MPANALVMSLVHASSYLTGNTMKPRDIFGVVIRALGIWFICEGAYLFALGFIKVHGGAPITEFPPPADFSLGSFRMLSGLFLIVGAEQLLNWTYGQTASAKEPSRDVEDQPESVQTTTRPETRPKTLAVVAAVSLLISFSDAIWYLYGRMAQNRPPDFARLTFIECLFGLALVAYLTSACLREFDRRLTRREQR
jgi:hypothetical protein